MHSKARNPLRPLLGFGFLVQGFRCFPWMAVNFFLKDGLRVAPSTLQLLQTSANLPMVGKPFYGVVSDAVYIRGEHRIPYIAIGVLLQAMSWLFIALLPQSSISIFTFSVLLLLGNLGASIAEVANDALVAEAGRQPTSTTSTKRTSSGELQSFAWMLGSVGGAIGNLLGGIAINQFSPKTMFLVFGLLLITQLFLTVAIRESSLDLPKSSSKSSIQKQLSELSVTLRKPEISYSIAWFALSYAIIPILTGTMFFYQTQYLKLDSSILGLSKVFGQAAMIIWSASYNKWLKSVPPRKLISALQATIAVFMVSDALFVKQVYRNFGVSDTVYVVFFSGLLEVLFLFKVLPFSVLMAQLCPPGCEGSLMAFLMSAIALAAIVSGYLGVALASFLGASAQDFSKLPNGILIQAACTIVPLYWSSWIPDYIKASKKVD
ncbi:probable folate-biopterin transporter 7 [Magnolia sinica]|uniref:probable folate-biopterin transporter 7 n=1 Tax=Magnolia sinica TaxID=86752 RepID=UPI002657E7BF|nr:probable folate-biopterin transporter 7 [Magnolia sinica]